MKKKKGFEIGIYAIQIVIMGFSFLFGYLLIDVPSAWLAFILGMMCFVFLEWVWLTDKIRW
jgi:hypothetical protein